MTTEEEIPQGRMLTEEEDCEMKENLARRNFGMSLDEFTEAWKAGKFDGDRGEARRRDFPGEDAA